MSVHYVSPSKRPGWLPVTGCQVASIMLLLAVDNAAAGKPIHTWFHYYGEESIKSLEAHADLVASISVFGEPTKAFVEESRKLGVETYRLVSGPAENIAPRRAQAIMDEYLTQCTELGFDGIDLDYEGLAASCRRDYADFIRALAGRLRAADK